MCKPWVFFAFLFATRFKFTVNTNGKRQCHELLQAPAKNHCGSQITCKLQYKMKASCARYPDVRANHKASTECACARFNLPVGLTLASCDVKTRFYCLIRTTKRVPHTGAGSLKQRDSWDPLAPTISMLHHSCA